MLGRGFMESLKPIKVPIKADSVLSPDFFYGDYTGIHFITSNDKHGRITFENLDAVKISRGEFMPFEIDYSSVEKGSWVFEVENSSWKMERYAYESKHYGESYEFGGNVEDMLTDFTHYLFSFHDQFIEVIARGFWFEESEQSLFKKELEDHHPFSPLPTNHYEELIVKSLRCQIRKNPKSQEQLEHDAQFCSQTLCEFALELDGEAMVSHTVSLFYRDGRLITALRSALGRQELVYEGFVSLDTFIPYMEKYIEDLH